MAKLKATKKSMENAQAFINAISWRKRFIISIIINILLTILIIKGYIYGF